MIKVFENFDFSRVGQMQSLLESHGIRTFLKNQYGSSVMGEVPFVEVVPQLFILEEIDLAQAKQLLVAGDVNAVPPAGIAGIATHDKCVALNSPEGAIGIGALAVGNVKYQLQHKLLKLLLEKDKPVYLDFRDAFSTAQEIV